MLTIIGSLLGFLTSAFPEILNIIKDKRDKKQELEILDRQIKMQIQTQKNQTEEIIAKQVGDEYKALYNHASIKSNIDWIEGVRCLVRPVLSYGFFALFFGIKIALLVKFHEFDMSINEISILIWDDETKALFAAIMSFWFGSRTFSRVS